MFCSKATNGVCALDKEAEEISSSSWGAQDGNTTGVVSGIFLAEPSEAGDPWEVPVQDHVRICGQMERIDLTGKKRTHGVQPFWERSETSIA